MTNNTIDLETLMLKRGGHGSFEQGTCLMEAVSYVAGEPFSDQPRCVSNVLGAFGRRLNDRMDDDERQQLKPFIPRLLNTAGDGQDMARAYLATDWVMRTAVPLYLDLAGLDEMAAQFRALAPIVDGPSSRAARGNTKEARAALQKMRTESRARLVERVKAEIAKRGLTTADADAYADAYAAAYAAAAADADAAADAAAYAYAAAAADAAADAYADADAYAAAYAYAYAYADDPDRWSKVYGAVRAKLLPIVRERFAPIRTQLVASQVDLFDRMIDPAGVEAA